LEELASGFMQARILLTAVELDVFLVLGEQELCVRELARRTRTEPAFLARLLNALVALKLLAKRQGHFRATAAARRHLGPKAKEYLGDMMLHRSSLWETWSKLTQVVRTGKASPRRKSRERERRFIKGMANIGAFSAQETAKALQRELRSASKLLDLGGGPATYACAFARSRPKLRATVLDLPGPLVHAEETISAEGLGERVSTRPGDALTLRSYGRSYDVVFMSNFLHCFKRPQAASIVRKAAGALKKGGHLAVKDFYIDDDGTSPPFTALFSINMMVADAGDSYSRQEVAAWMQAAGIRPQRFVEIAHSSGILVGKKP
jgi:2-polyprenyl-3-methyl-5-hydroxy-6-metoxy-1,4-benzoquinol methylase